MRSANASQFVVCEGLTGSGKSTLAQGLADVMDWQLVPVIESHLADAIRSVDDDPSALEARHALFCAAVFRAARVVEANLADGLSCVTDSWFGRTTATHLALGSTIRITEPPWTPRPTTTFWLSIDESTRARRMRTRGTRSSYWKLQLEGRSETIVDLYRELVPEMVSLDATKAPDLVLREAIAAVHRTSEESYVLVRDR